MILHVEGQQIVAQQPVEDLVLPGADAEGFAVGPRNVPELHDDEVRPRVAEHPREQRKVIVLDEDDAGLARPALRGRRRRTSG